MGVGAGAGVGEDVSENMSESMGDDSSVVLIVHTRKKFRQAQQVIIGCIQDKVRRSKVAEEQGWEKEQKQKEEEEQAKTYDEEQ